MLGQKQLQQQKAKERERQTSPSSTRSRGPLTTYRPNQDEENEENYELRGQFEGVNWVQCDICYIWYHLSCVNTSFSWEYLEGQEWVCYFCTQ